MICDEIFRGLLSYELVKMFCLRSIHHPSAKDFEHGPIGLHKRTFNDVKNLRVRIPFTIKLVGGHCQNIKAFGTVSLL